MEFGKLHAIEREMRNPEFYKNSKYYLDYSNSMFVVSLFFVII